MPAPESLKDVYADEIKDLWSANDQMVRALTTLTGKAHDPKLKTFLEESVAGIGRHNETLKSLLQDSGEEVEKEHCKGMEGLVKEALKHGVKEAPEDGELLDIVIIAQYQRMSHYGIAGFGSAAAYARALGQVDRGRHLQGRRDGQPDGREDRQARGQARQDQRRGLSRPVPTLQWPDAAIGTRVRPVRTRPWPEEVTFYAGG